MRVGIAGIMSGKTLIAERIAQRYGLPLIANNVHDTARMLEIKSFKNLSRNKDCAKEYQVKLLITLLKEKQEKTAFVSDITVFDLLAHWRVYGLNDSSALDKMYASKLHKCSGLYDLVILTKTLASDKSPVKDFIRRVEKELWTMLLIRKHHDRVVIVEGNEAQRVQAAIKAVDLFLSRKLMSGVQIITA